MPAENYNKTTRIPCNSNALRCHMPAFKLRRNEQLSQTQQTRGQCFSAKEKQAEQEDILKCISSDLI